MSRIYRNFLVAEIAVIIAVIVIFKLIGERLKAGMVAGSVFVALGAWLVLVGIRTKGVRRSFAFPLACVHLFAVALPMMITRLLNFASAFEDVRILGLPGPLFHRLSTGVYLMLLMATVIDLVRALRSEKSARVAR